MGLVNQMFANSLTDSHVIGWFAGSQAMELVVHSSMTAMDVLVAQFSL